MITALLAAFVVGGTIVIVGGAILSANEEWRLRARQELGNLIRESRSDRIRDVVRRKLKAAAASGASAGRDRAKQARTQRRKRKRMQFGTPAKPKTAAKRAEAETGDGPPGDLNHGKAPVFPWREMLSAFRFRKGWLVVADPGARIIPNPEPEPTPEEPAPEPAAEPAAEPEPTSAPEPAPEPRQDSETAPEHPTEVPPMTPINLPPVPERQRSAAEALVEGAHTIARTGFESLYDIPRTASAFSEAANAYRSAIMRFANAAQEDAGVDTRIIEYYRRAGELGVMMAQLMDEGNSLFSQFYSGVLEKAEAGIRIPDADLINAAGSGSGGGGGGSLPPLPDPGDVLGQPAPVPVPVGASGQRPADG